MPVSFEGICLGSFYSRNDLSRRWGYDGIEGLARGVVTPRDDNKIILFVTEEKQSDLEPYDDKLVGSTLHWEGPTDYFAEKRMVDANRTDDEIHLFYREKHHSSLSIRDRWKLLSYEVSSDHRAGSSSEYCLVSDSRALLG